METTDERIRTRRTFKSPMLVLGAIMTIVYLCLGAWLLLDKSALPGIAAEVRKAFATMLVVYGVYRGWRVYADYF
jgi:cytochrome oxidase assembly protein ShyY1